MIHYQQCPACQSKTISEVLVARDNTVSQQDFAIWQCGDCSLRFTQNVPGLEHIGPYYKSDAYISHSETNKGLINKLYLFVRNRTMLRKLDLVQRFTKRSTGNLLDVGCGAGSFLATMQASGWATVGLEPDFDTRQRVAAKGLEVHSNEHLFALQPGRFDAITLWHVLEHVHQLHDYLHQFRQLLKPGGKLLIAVPNYQAKEAGIYGAAWAAYDVPRHLYHFSPKSLQLLVQKHGLRVEKMLPMYYDSFYISMLSEKIKHGKGNLLRAIWNGLRSNAKALGDVTQCSSVIYVIEAAN
jgi:2-polyprenyl-3-methyl-5-hydroxy-6-metoxy-1,4-benzoquinol methylase